MNKTPEGDAIVYCQGAFNTPNGKTAHGLVRYTRRYNVLSVVDLRYAGRDSGEVLDGKQNGIPVFGSVEKAVRAAKSAGRRPTHLVIGIAPDGGRLDQTARKDIERALKLNLNLDSGLHDWFADDPKLSAMARKRGLTIRDVRRSPPPGDLRFFSGIIEHVDSAKIAVLGTDSAVGKRTTALQLVRTLEHEGFRAEMVGTGQTAWFQGVRYGIILDGLINDFVAGELENAVWLAWYEQQPDAIVVEGQGSLLHPAYPGGFEILAAVRPQAVVLQDAPGRSYYDGFPDYPIHPLKKQIAAIETVSESVVVAVTVNSEGLRTAQLRSVCEEITRDTGLPAVDPLTQGLGPVLDALRPFIRTADRCPRAVSTLSDPVGMTRSPTG